MPLVYGFTFGTGYYFRKYTGLAKDWGRKGGTLRPPSKVGRCRLKPAETRVESALVS
jgi:hypothetical protein